MAIHKFFAFGQQDFCRSGTASAEYTRSLRSVTPGFCRSGIASGHTQDFLRSVNKISVVRSHKFPSFGQYVLWKSFIAQLLQIPWSWSSFWNSRNWLTKGIETKRMEQWFSHTKQSVAPDFEGVQLLEFEEWSTTTSCQSLHQILV